MPKNHLPEQYVSEEMQFLMDLLPRYHITAKIEKMGHPIISWELCVRLTS